MKPDFLATGGGGVDVVVVGLAVVVVVVGLVVVVVVPGVVLVDLGGWAGLFSQL